MNIEKEREEFELNISPVIWERIEYNAENNIYMAKSKYWTSSIVQAVANEIDFGWKMWQAAKAQAMPEGFVLVPKEPSADLVNHGHQVFLGHFNEGGQTGGRSLYFAYKAMIEAAQEQSK